MQNQTIRHKIEQLFGYPAMKMPWSLYIAQLNEAGKLTARSIMDIMTVVLEVLEQQEGEVKLMSEPKSSYADNVKVVTELENEEVIKIMDEVEKSIPESIKNIPELEIMPKEVKDSKLPEELQEEKA